MKVVASTEGSGPDMLDSAELRSGDLLVACLNFVPESVLWYFVK